MKRYSKILSIILSLSLMTTSLVACSSSKTEDVDKSNESVSTDPSKKDLSGDLVYMSMWNEAEPQAEMIKSVVKQFESDYPKVKVEVQWIGRSSNTTVPVAIKAGQQVDVFDNVLYADGPDMFEDLTDLVNSPSYDMDGRTVRQSIHESLWMADQEASKAAGLTGIYGIPCSPFVVSFFYNKDLFKSAGITDAPKTWDDLLVACQKLVDKGIVPMTTDDAYMNLTYSYYLSKLIGKDGILKLAADTKDPLWKDSAIKNTLSEMEKLSSKKYLSENVKTNKYPAGQQEFALGQAAMYLNASWFPGEIAATAGPDFPYGEFAFPNVSGGIVDNTCNTVGCIPFNVSSKSENKDAAKEFIKYIAGQKFQKELSDLGFAPATVDTPWPKVLSDQGPIVNETKVLIPYEAGFVSDFIKGSVIPQFNKVMTGATTAEKAYDEIMSKVGN